MPSSVHIIGAGLSGLAAAVRLTAAGRAVTVYEAANHAGGRCRSFHDESLGCEIDNGNHLILSGNRAVFRFLADIGADDRLTGPSTAAFAFFDLETGSRWTLRLSPGVIPWWIWQPSRRVPDTRAADYLRGLSLAVAGRRTVADCLSATPQLYRRFWEPLAVAVLNTPADEASAALLWPVIRQTVARGERFCRPRMAAEGLNHCFIEPALSYLRQRGAIIRFGARVRRLAMESGRVDGLEIADGGMVDLAAGSHVVLAVPPGPAEKLLPGLTVPDASQAIVNVHYRLPTYAPQTSMIGLVGGTAQWIFCRRDVASVTVSAANGLAGEQNEQIAALVWPEVARALTLAFGPPPPSRVIKEKRATFSQSPCQVRRRPKTGTEVRNLWLCGDWTDTGLPATIEGSVQSGNTAARAILASQTSA